MEKLIYVIWKPEGSSVTVSRDRLLEETAEKLIELGACKLSMNLADELSKYAWGSRITRQDPPLFGTISLWLDTALERRVFEEAIQQATERVAGYLVTESVPIVNTTEIAPLGERTPGITMVAFLKKPGRITYEEWLVRWQGGHTQVAIDTQSTFLYVQNVVVRAVTEDAPPWTAIVEEGFPKEAPTDPMIFYAAQGREQRLRENQKKMIESCQRFIDFDELESHPTSSYSLKE